ncbi:MAG: EscU/YscU/HrcU family type III secretion system export apparatus switch protein, partial [Treponema sp.]|nr:EscU/YscU/HrcU family type III secretion system export apparatus switch protein [Treponema sp.]
MKKKPFCPAPGGLPEGDQEPEAAVPAQDSYILLCDVLIAGSDSAVGIKYDEENMFVPMIVMLEKGSPAYALIHSAETLGVPVVKNFILAKNLVSYGKAGAAIPELTYRDVSMVLARLGSQGHMRRSPGFWEKSRNVPAGIRRPLALELG